MGKVLDFPSFPLHLLYGFLVFLTVVPCFLHKFGSLIFLFICNDIFMGKLSCWPQKIEDGQFGLFGELLVVTLVGWSKFELFFVKGFVKVNNGILAFGLMFHGGLG